MHRADLRRGFRLLAGPSAKFVNAEASAAERAAQGLWHRDPSVWSADASVQDKIARRLGWLDSPVLMAASIDRIKAAADDVRRSGFADVVLLGMGGSSLAPEVLRRVIGVQAGWPRLHMLDSTDPAAVRGAATDPASTLYILASKSGTTIEPNSLAAHFQRVLKDAGVARWASHFVAITDEETALARRARAEGFRHLFVNPFDIGGRYSALSFFGLVPAALMGQDISEIIRWGMAMLDEARTAADDVRSNPAVALGLLLGAAARSGRDKLTLVLPPILEPFGLWVEQLVAESTGKQGVGIVPIAGETLGVPDVYADDRLFVRLRLTSDSDEKRRDRAMQDLAHAPIATIEFPEPSALGAEFMRWEIATAVAGALLGINPFDEPNVQQAKDATGILLDRYKADGRLPTSAPDHVTASGVSMTLTSVARSELAQRGPAAFLSVLDPGDYLALLAYLGPDPALDDALHRFRMSVRDFTRTATMSGYGPRYLHSTGQLHKGGPNTGVFVLITARATQDLDIPGQPFSFGTLELAQALGDFASLEATGRRAVHVHLPSPDARVLNDALTALLGTLSSRGSQNGL